MGSSVVTSGIEALDAVIEGLRPGDNVVWQVDGEADYRLFAEAFARATLDAGLPLAYLRFAAHPPVLAPRQGLEVLTLDPRPGFDTFSRAVHQIIEERGVGARYVFDNLSALTGEWATDELLATFFQATCPYLYELDTVTYFALSRGRHAHAAVARIRDTTQVLIDAYRVDGRLFIHPLKVWDRYSPQMFLPHLAEGDAWQPVSRSADAAAAGVVSRRRPLLGNAESTAPWDTVYRRLAAAREAEGSAGTGGAADDPEQAALRRELRKMLVGGDPEFARICDAHFTTDDLLAIRERLIGSGRVGGKAAGMLLAQRIVGNAAASGGTELAGALVPHDSFYIGSDVFFTFLVTNDLFRARLQYTKRGAISREEFCEIEERFLAGHFPDAVQEQFRQMLDYFGQAPIIVRSSSLLEDGFSDAFAGKYRSEFCANQGTPEQRLEAFTRAVKLVYASALNPDALSYRRRRGLDESDEQMAVLVQRVSGAAHGRYFFPTLAGVAFSKNLYAWSDRIDPAKGVIRMVYGLGTRAVERVSSDYPRMVAVSNPLLRPEVGQRIARYSQRFVDVLDLDANALVTLPVGTVLAAPNQPALHYLVSVLSDGDVLDPVSNWVDPESGQLVLTFNRLIRQTPLVRVLGAMLEALEAAYGRPIDTEFTAFVDSAGAVRVQILQCRPLVLPGITGAVSFPSHLPAERVLFRSSRLMGGGDIRDIRHIVLIDPRWYAAIRDEQTKRSLGRIVGRLNAHPRLAEGRLMLMGPGRWGSSNLHLGVNVGYADIDNAAVLVEMAREADGHLPEVSYGTHFFQDLVEAQILYLALFPEDPEACFQEEFFARAPNALGTLLPDAAPLAEVIRVIDVPASAGGRSARLVADPQARKAVCYLDD